MIKLPLALFVLAVSTPASILASQAAPPGSAAADPGAPAVTAPAAIAPVVPIKVDYAADPRMILAIRMANARADATCGQGIGNVDLSTRNAAHACRRHLIKAATTNAEIAIDGR